MTRKIHEIYDFAGFRLNIGERLLLKNGAPVSLQPKAFDLLCVLVQNPGRLLDKDELLKAVWGDTVVEEVNLANNISILRKVLGESDATRFIETVPRRGYRFIASPVASVAEDTVAVQEFPSNALTLEFAPHSVGAPESQTLLPLSSKRRARGFLWLFLAGLTVVVGGAVLSRSVFHNSETTTGAVRLLRLTSDSGLTTEPALSPDGSLVAYASDRGGHSNLDIWIQPLNGSGPLRLTDHEANDTQPDFSPNGASIAFRSERGGGGIYVVPALGGAVRMVAKGGNRPRFSPDGKYIAYWTGEIGFDGPGDITAPGTSAIFIVPAAGGEPRQLCPDFAGARLPTWSPDGKKILFLGVREPSINPLFADPEVVDWWITPVEGGPAVKTGAYAALARKGINYANPNVWVAKRNLVLFSATLGDSRNVWQLPVSPMGEISGEAERLTSGVGSEGYPLLAGNRLVFASLTRNQDIWSLPIQADHGHPTGSLQRIVSSDAAEEHPYISSDGKMLAFDSSRSGNRDIWVKDLTTGAETSITSTPLNERWPMLSLDRSRIAFSVTKNGKQPVYVGQLWGGAFEKACDDCSRLDDWSSDGKKMLYHGAERRRIGIIELDTGRRRQIVAHSRHNLYQPHFSRDGQWICFLEQLDPVHRRLLIVPSDPSRETPQQMWIPVTSGQYSDDKPRFSPGGNLIYFVSDRDGFMCLWVQRLHPKSKRPIQTPFVIHHFHDSRLSFRNASLGSVEISVAPDKIVFNPGELTGNVWMAELGNRQ